MARVPPVLPLGEMLSEHYVLAPGRLEALDQYASEMIDAVDGGQYAPKEPLIIGGAGLDLQGGCSITGDVSVADESRLVLSPSTLPTFGAARTRTVVVNLNSLIVSSPSPGNPRFEVAFEPNYGIRSLAGGQFSWCFSLPSLRLHHGATLLSARLFWSSGDLPEQILDSEIPMFRILRVKKEGVEATDFGPGPNVAELWKVPFRVNSTFYNVDDVFTIPGGFGWGSNGLTYRCITAGTTAAAQPGGYSIVVGNNQIDGTATFRVEYGWSNGFFHFQFPPLPLALNRDDYHQLGNPQEILHRVNQNATIDTETYSYCVELLEPGGRNVEEPVGSGITVSRSYRNVYHSIVLEIGNLTELREP